MAPHWQSAPPETTIWAQWEDAYVVHHLPSGKTHVLNAPGATLLREILADPKSMEAAAAALAERQAAKADEAFAAYVAETIKHLEHLGLVEAR